MTKEEPSLIVSPLTRYPVTLPSGFATAPNFGFEFRDSVFQHLSYTEWDDPGLSTQARWSEGTEGQTIIAGDFNVKVLELGVPHLESRKRILEMLARTGLVIWNTASMSQFPRPMCCSWGCRVLKDFPSSNHDFPASGRQVRSKWLALPLGVHQSVERLQLTLSLSFEPDNVSFQDPYGPWSQNVQTAGRRHSSKWQSIDPNDATKHLVGKS